MAEPEKNERLIIKKGHTYELADGRIGTLKFEGKTQFKPGVVWYGFELGPDFKGKNDGTVAGVNYFKCAKGQGVFVKRNKIKGKASARKSKQGEKAEHKAGAVETGRQEYLDGFEVKDDGSDFLDPKTKHVGDAEKAEKKLGPREIGRSDYDPGLAN